MRKKILLIVPILSLLLSSCVTTSGSSQPSKSSNLNSDSFVSSETNLSSQIGDTSLPISSNNVSSLSSDNSSTSQSGNAVRLEIFALNDMHGNVYDSSNGLGIAKTATLLKSYPKNVNNALYVSQGDMWQGSAASNLTRGQLVNDWMGQLHFTSMTMGNHEFDWSSSYVEENSKTAAFPYLGINIFSRETNQRVDYLQPSTVVNKNGAKIGIIGAIGDCYSSISGSMVKDIYFKVGNELTELVKQEATRLKTEEKCDFIIYSLHDDNSYYDASLSNGYVDLVFEGHTHKDYCIQDKYGVYHIQSAGYNQTINYIDIELNVDDDSFVVKSTKSLRTNNYSYLNDDSEALALFDKYADVINPANDVLGNNSRYRDSTYLRQLVADLYLQYGTEKWGSAFNNIFLAGGYISCRSPYKLEAGPVTYADIYTLFPFDNDLVLCSISGYYLDKQFVNSTNDNYYISYTEYGNSARNNINPDDTYILITDTYSSDYEPNHLTVISRYSDEGFYARDMIARYVEAGNFE